jgi:uncharacterized membrane protein YkoI
MKFKKMMIPAAAAAVVLLTGSVFAAKQLAQKAPAEPTVQQQVSVTNAQANNSAPTATAIASTNTAITAEKAKEIALNHAGLKASDVTFVRAQLDWDDGRQEYEVEFYSGNVEHDYDIDASTGEILSYDRDAEFHAPKSVGTKAATAPTASDNTAITAEKAKEIALQHAGLKASDVTFVRAQLDWDDGRQEYEVEFYSGNVEYDYDIDAETGEILSYDRDAEFYKPKSAAAKATQAPGKVIGEAKAKSVALQHAGFKENEVSRLTAEYDWDDGRAEYDVEFNVGQIEYSYEIDAASGKVLSYEAEKDD